MAFADPPTVDVTPTQGFLGESFYIDITATSESTASGIKVIDPDDNIWVLKGFSSGVWKIVTIRLPDAGDKIRYIWPETISSPLSVLNDPGTPIEITTPDGSLIAITDLAWWNKDNLPSHTSFLGTYKFWFSGTGCTFLKVVSIYVFPEGPLGTLSFLLICVASLVMYKRVRRPQVKL